MTTFKYDEGVDLAPLLGEGYTYEPSTGCLSYPDGERVRGDHGCPLIVYGNGYAREEDHGHLSQAGVRNDGTYRFDVLLHEDVAMLHMLGVVGGAQQRFLMDMLDRHDHLRYRVTADVRPLDKAVTPERLRSYVIDLAPLAERTAKAYLHAGRDNYDHVFGWCVHDGPRRLYCTGDVTVNLTARQGGYW